MKTISKRLIPIVLFFTSLVFAQELDLNANKSKLFWTGKAAFNSYTLTGTLDAQKGFIKVENGSIVELEVTINMKSLDHDNKDLKSHLRSKDFFEVNTYKTAKFRLTEPANINNGKGMLKGLMTIKERTQTEVIEIQFQDNIISFKHTMDRTLYDIKFNSPSIFKKMKENAIADDFILKASLQFE